MQRGLLFPAARISSPRCGEIAFHQGQSRPHPPEKIRNSLLDSPPPDR
jgi:hypothetical protein